MKLQNLTTYSFVAALVVVISIWAAIFYYALLDEIYDSIDDGLDNQKHLILQRVATDSSLLGRSEFGESGFMIRELPPTVGISSKDRYVDTSMYMVNEDDYEPVRLLTTAFRRGDRFYQLQVATSMVEEDDLVTELLYALLWLYLGLVVSLILLNKLLLARIWKSFYFLVDQLKKYRLNGNEDIAVQDTRIEEFRLLNENIQSLLKRTKATYNSQKQFLENASHELQTPLAISINKLETLAARESLTGEDLQLLAAALDNLERMTRLNRSLLLLSKIENKQFIASEQVNINQVARNLVTELTEQAEYSKVSVHIEEQGECLVNGNADLATILLTNLIKNAIVHNKEGGQVNILLRNCELSIENTGAATPLNTASMYARFYKEQPSSASTGLGLAIVKAITDVYNYDIAYTFTNRRHVFTIRFTKQ